MAPRTRKAAASSAPATHNGDTPPLPPPKDDAPPTPIGVDALLVPVAVEEREEVKVNNASATDMKHACDDALKRVSIPSSVPSRCRTRRSERYGVRGSALCLARHELSPLSAAYVTRSSSVRCCIFVSLFPRVREVLRCGCGRVLRRV